MSADDTDDESNPKGHSPSDKRTTTSSLPHRTLFHFFNISEIDLRNGDEEKCALLDSGMALVSVATTSDTASLGGEIC